MKALMTTDAAAFFRGVDGRIYTQSPANYDECWAIPRSSFDEIIVITRVRNMEQPEGIWRFADGDGVTFRSVPFYHGPYQYLKVIRGLRAAIRTAVEECDVVICLGPGFLGEVAIDIARKLKKLYALDVIADPYDVFAPGAMKHSLRPFFRWRYTHLLQYQCTGACAVNYVTKQALQRRYPPSPTALSMGVSDVFISNAVLVSTPRPLRQETRTLNIIFVGTLAQLYKAPDVLIDAFFVCVREGLDIKLTLVGDGKHRPELEARAAALGIEQRVCFLKQLPAGDAVRTQLDQADLFVLPSYQEGLPRAMVEAMARALPVIGSTVGGIPELLPPEDMVPPGNVIALAQKIQEVVTDPQRMTRMSARNLEKAKEYRQDVLWEQRTAFYYGVREKTKAWLRETR